MAQAVQPVRSLAMDGNTTTQGPGATTAPAGDGGAAGGLRARGAEALSGDAKRGRGRPPGSTSKPKEKSEAPAAKPSKAPEFVYSKTGKAFRALSNIAALQCNNRIFLLTPEEEKDLGESVGDIFLELGLSDTMAAKVIFAVGTVSAVFGTKAIAYAAYKASQPKPMRAAVPQVGPAPKVAAAPEAPGSTPGPEPKSGDAGIPETKPGTL